MFDDLYRVDRCHRFNQSSFTIHNRALVAKATPSLKFTPARHEAPVFIENKKLPVAAVLLLLLFVLFRLIFLLSSILLCKSAQLGSMAFAAWIHMLPHPYWETQPGLLLQHVSIIYIETSVHSDEHLALVYKHGKF